MTLLTNDPKRKWMTYAPAPAGSLRSAPRRASADPTPMCFTIAMAWTIVMSKGRTRSAGRYITLPDIGVGACGRNTVTQSFSSGSSRYAICQPSSPKSVANPLKGLFFDLDNSTVTRAVWDEDNNLVEMTYCAVTGGVLSKKITKRIAVSILSSEGARWGRRAVGHRSCNSRLRLVPPNP